MVLQAKHFIQNLVMLMTINLPNNFSLKKAIRQYIVDNGIEEYVEKNGKVPASYTEYEKNLAEQTFNIDYDSKAVFMQVASENYGGGSSRIIFSNTAYFVGFKNVLSSFQFCGLYGYTTLYDKAFFVNKLLTYSGKANIWYNLGGTSFDNKTESLVLWW